MIIGRLEKRQRPVGTMLVMDSIYWPQLLYTDPLPNYLQESKHTLLNKLSQSIVGLRKLQQLANLLLRQWIKLLLQVVRESSQTPLNANYLTVRRLKPLISVEISQKKSLDS